MTQTLRIKYPLALYDARDQPWLVLVEFEYPVQAEIDWKMLSADSEDMRFTSWLEFSQASGIHANTVQAALLEVMTVIDRLTPRS